MTITTKRVSYDDPTDRADLLRLLEEYASPECGDDLPHLAAIPEKLQSFPTAFSVLAYLDPEQTVAIGLVNCFFGFSTFVGKSLVNIHDVIVTQEHRGQGVSGVMLAAVEEIAREHDCCRVTLEVLADNRPARRAYEKHGFTRDPAHPDTETYFLRKSLI